NFDSRMKALRPRVSFRVPNTMSDEGMMPIDLTFEALEDFSPAAVAARIDSLRRLLDARQELDTLLAYVDGKKGAQTLLAGLLQNPVLIEALEQTRPRASGWWWDVTAESQTQVPSSITALAEDFELLLQKECQRRTESAERAIADAVRTLAAEATAHPELIRSDAVETISKLIREANRQLTAQINLILHHEDFRTIEGAWRGLYYLVSNTETNETLKIRVLNITKAELAKTLRRFRGPGW